MKLRKTVLLILACLLLPCAGIPARGSADEDTSSIDAVLKGGDGGLHQMGARVLGFLLFVGLLFAGYLHWNRKRNAGMEATIRVLAVRGLGQREKIAIVEVLGDRMVVGVTAHGISLLAKSPGTQSLPEPEKGGRA